MRCVHLRQVDSPYLLSSIVRCGKCEATMVVQRDLAIAIGTTSVVTPVTLAEGAWRHDHHRIRLWLI
ncbi:hypothetical protein ACFLXX_05270 [Chloroflexota bacterium]